MPYGELTGIQGLRERAETLSRNSAASQQSFAAEIAGTVDAEPLFQLVSRMDKRAAGKPNASNRQEHTNAFCLARDHRYAHRSRRWLLARALAGDMERAYQQWAAFLRTNYTTRPELIELLDQDVRQIVHKSAEEVLR